MAKNILIGITSGIAAYKVAKLIDNLRGKGFTTDLIMTESAIKMAGKEDFEKVSGTKAYHELFPKDFDYKKVLEKREVDHIKLADIADIVCIAPATANTIAKLAHGIGDDFLTTTLLAATSPVIICPSMNVNMWQNPATQANLEILQKRGFIIIHPDSGDLACGYRGVGRLPEVEVIEKEILNTLEKSEQFKGKKVIVTAGGTEENIDGVRVITNKSSGKMGIAIADEFSKRGAEVTLIKAKTSVNPNSKVEVLDAISSDEMFEAMKNNAPDAGIIVHAAAVSDFKVADEFTTKIDSKKDLDLKLIPTKKIVNQIKEWNPEAFLVAFKAVTNLSEEEIAGKAKNLLTKSNADLVVANDVAKNNVFGSNQNEVILYFKDRQSILLPLENKQQIAQKILDYLSKYI